MKKILITGSAGFIGYHLVSIFLSDDSYKVIGLDFINEYYDINLKYARLAKHGIYRESISKNLLIQSSIFSNYQFIQADLADHDFIVEFVIKRSLIMWSTWQLKLGYDKV